MNELKKNWLKAVVIDVKQLNDWIFWCYGGDLDANITTFIVVSCSITLGSGPIQGFAVTMMLGIIATLIATLFFLNLCLTLFLIFLIFKDFIRKF